MDKLLKLEEVLAAVNISRQWLYQLMRQGRFPKPIKIGIRRVRWRESDVARWIAEGGVRPQPKRNET